MNFFQSVRFSMDGKGRCIDNVFIERLWWLVKYENAYIRAYENGKELYQGLTHYFNQYNHERRHAGINDELPSNRYFSSKNSQILGEELLKEKYLKNFKSA